MRTSFTAWIILLFTSSATALAQAPGAPSILYHYGQWQYLIQDIEAHTIPQATWDQFILGNDTRYGQKWYRRGLYGTSHPSYSAYFADIATGYENSTPPWMIAIHLKHECTEEKPFDLSTLYQDPRAQVAIQQLKSPQFPTGKEFKDRCYVYSSEYDRLLPQFESITGTAPETSCEVFLNQLFVILKPRIIIDGDWAESWYIRDRDCIADITGTPDQMMKIFSDPSFWKKNTPSGELRASTVNENGSLLPLLILALSKTNVQTPEKLKAVKDALSTSDIRNPSGWDSVTAPTLNWVATRGVALVNRYQECILFGRKDWYQGEISRELNNLVKLSYKEFEIKVDHIVDNVRCL